MNMCARQSRSFENIRDAEFSCSSFNDVTTPSRDLFIIYADRKLLQPATIARIETQFLLPTERTEIHSDLHYKSNETPNVLGRDPVSPESRSKAPHSSRTTM